MKKVLFAAFAALLLCSCGNSDTDLQYFPFQSERDGKWGMISADGDVLFENEFKSECSLTVAMRDRFWVKYEGEGYGEYYYKLFKAAKRPDAVTNDRYSQVGDFIEDVAPVVKKDGGIQFIDRDGKLAFKLEKVNGKRVVTCTNFINGYAVFNTDENRAGLIDTKGKVIIEPKKYILLGPVSDGRLLAIDKKYEDSYGDDRKFTILNVKGEELSTFSFSKFERFSSLFYNGLLAAAKEDKGWGFINDKAEWVVPATSKIKGLMEPGTGPFDRYVNYNDDLCIFKGEDGYGVYNISKGEVVLKAKFDMLDFADKSGKLLWAENERGKYDLINLEGETVGECDAKNIHFFYGDVAFVKEGSHSWIAVDKKGKEQKLKDLNGKALEIYNLDFNTGSASVSSEKE